MFKLLTLVPAPIILYSMKKRISALFIVFLLGACCAAFCGEPTPSFESYVRYFAGIDMLATDARCSQPQKAQRYRRLCRLTGVNGEMAKAFVRGYQNDPEGWQKFTAAVLEVLQKKG
jgi:hypothetical protein